MSEIKKTVKYAGIYAIGIFMSKIVSFIMLPIYTRYLSPADYGTIELLTMTVDVFGMIASVGLTAAVYRFYYRYERIEDRYKVISTIMTMLIIIYLLASGIGFFISDSLATLILRGEPSGSFYFRLMFLGFFFQAFIETPMLFIKAQQRPLLFVSFSLIRLVLQLSLNIYFVVVLKMQVLGVLYSTLIASGCVGTILVIHTYLKTGVHYSKELSSKLIYFGAPFILSNIGDFILTFSDRYFLKAYTDISTVGIYSLGYKLGFILWLFPVRPIMSIWGPQRFEIVNRPDCQNMHAKVFFILNLMVMSVALGISLFSLDLFRVMSDVRFWPAYKIVPMIMVAYTIQAWTSFGNFGVMYRGQTRYVAYGTVAAAFTILFLSYLLIPEYKAYGAAIATIIAFLLRFLVIYHFSQKLYFLELPWKKITIMFGIAVSVYLGAQTIRQEQILLSIGVNSFSFAMFIVGLLLLPVLDSKEKQILLNVLRHPYKAMKGGGVPYA